MVNLFRILLVLSLSLNSFAFTRNLKTGDILLQPLKCWSCSLIEAQEDSEYSHIGVYINIDGEDFVVEAFGKVQLISLNEYLKKTEPGLSVRVKRFNKIEQISRDVFSKVLLSFVGLPYDRNFLWNNLIDGKEAIYCSELVYKAFIYFTDFENLSTKKMLFDVNPKMWDQYFRGKAPRGKIGISPADFDKSSDFDFIDEIYPQ